MSRVHLLITLERLDEAVAAAQVARCEAAAANDGESLAILERMAATAVRRQQFQEELAIPLATVLTAPLAIRAAVLARRAVALLGTGQTEAAALRFGEAEACLADAEVGPRLDALLILAQVRRNAGDLSRAREHITAAEQLATSERPDVLAAVHKIRRTLDPAS